MFSRENINALEDTQGELHERHNEILQVIHSHSTQLYDVPRESSEGRWARRELLQLVNHGITEAQAGALDAVQEDEEITKLVQSFKKKARPPVWTGLQQSSYKGVGSSSKMIAAKCKISGEENLFVKLDFSKVSDRVAFKYLWGVLSRMGFSESTIQRIRALMVGGASSIHVNQDLTKPVKIKCGVRQGCPLAPLLFALSSQSLMKAFQIEEQGTLRGLKLPGLEAITHELFADDRSIFISASVRGFTKVKRVIEKYELASGAALNMQKSLVMALGKNAAPHWVNATGRKIADRWKRFKFLGVRSGRGINSTEITEVVLKSIEMELKVWVYRYLTWKSRLLLIKHICAVIPQHVLMSVGIDSKRSRKIENLLGNFLWGWSRDKIPKTALLAWNKLPFPTEAGGLGWTAMEIKWKLL
ncbi:hypothetical protein R1sor_008041 [Riccia sorocarpa]|uniref:Reverse transcriptase domain-containing protein n=1 Tax=Riccia sorocarpa TaxID=122646 RepID=A0ABD3HVT9_9MARC